MVVLALAASAMDFSTHRLSLAWLRSAHLAKEHLASWLRPALKPPAVFDRLINAWDNDSHDQTKPTFANSSLAILVASGQML